MITVKSKRFKIAVLLILAFAVFVGYSGTAANAAPMGDVDFIRLVRAGTVQEVETAIRAGANVNAILSYFGPTIIEESLGTAGLTALMSAARDNPNPEVIAVLRNC